MIAPNTRRKILAALISSCLLLAAACQSRIPDVTKNATVPETVVSEEPTTEGSVLAETVATTISEETTTVAEVTTSETTLAPTVTTAAPTPTVTPAPTSTPVPTKAPTPKPTKAPVETTAAPPPTTAATTAAPTDPPPPTTTAASYKENPDNIRALIVQYCVENGRWTPDAESTGGGSITLPLGDFLSDTDYANFYISRKVSNTTWMVKSVSCWVDGDNIYFSHEEG